MQSSGISVPEGDSSPVVSRRALVTGSPVVSRRALVTGSAVLAGGALLSLAGCANGDETVYEKADSADSASAGDEGAPATDRPLPPAQPDPDSEFGVDANINMGTIDGYLFRDDVAYRDLRLFEDPADYESIGGSSKLSMAIKGFTVVPYPHLGTLADLPVSGAYDGPCLFDVTWGDNLEILDAKPNYTQSMMILEELFPKDRPIFLMCGGAGYAAMGRALLVHLGWNEELLYNVGGQWTYEGPNLEQIISYADPDKPEYYLWRLDMPLIDFDLLYPAPADSGAGAGADDGGNADPYAFGSEEPVPQENLMSADEFEAAANAGDALIIDVRTPAVASLTQFPWELPNIPVNQLALRDREFADAGAVIIAAANNEEGARAFNTLVDLGFPADDIKVLDGGMKGWLMDFRDYVVNPPRRFC